MHRFASFLRLGMVAALLAGIFAQPQTVHAASLPAEINKQFTPLQIDAGGVSVLRISIFNPNTFPLSNVAFIDDLARVQPGLYVANPAGVANTCGGTVTAVPGATTVSLSGGAVPAQVGPTPGQCYIDVNISSVTVGNLINTIPAHNPPADIGLTADGNDNGTPVVITNTSPASATITVVAVSPPALSKTFAPNTIFVGQTSLLTIRLNNNDADTNLTGVSYTDTLPSGLAIASPSGLSVANCGAGATVTAPANGTAVSLSNGTVTPSQDCVISVNVIGSFGQYTNTIPAGPGGPGSVQTNQGVTNASSASANLNIQPVGITKGAADHNQGRQLGQPTCRPAREADHSQGRQLGQPTCYPAAEADHNQGRQLGQPTCRPAGEADHNQGRQLGQPTCRPAGAAGHNQGGKLG